MYFFFILFSCAQRISFPGPTHSVGSQSKDYADRYGIQALGTPDSVIVTSEAGKQSKGKNSRRHKKHAGEEIASVTSSYIGKTKLRVDGSLFRYDCSGLVEAMYFAAGQPISGSAKMMYEQSKEHRVFHKDCE